MDDCGAAFKKYWDNHTYYENSMAVAFAAFVYAWNAAQSNKHTESVIYETEQEKNLRLRKLVDSVALNPKPAVIATQNRDYRETRGILKPYLEDESTKPREEI